MRGRGGPVRGRWRARARRAVEHVAQCSIAFGALAPARAGARLPPASSGRMACETVMMYHNRMRTVCDTILLATVMENTSGIGVSTDFEPVMSVNVESSLIISQLWGKSLLVTLLGK